MRTFLVLICSLALACAAAGQVSSTGGGGAQKKKQTQSAQPAPKQTGATIVNFDEIPQPAKPSGKATGKPAQAGGAPLYPDLTTAPPGGRHVQPTAAGKATTAGKPPQQGVIRNFARDKPPRNYSDTHTLEAVVEIKEGSQATGAGKAKAKGKPTEDATKGLYGTSQVAQRSYENAQKPSKPTPTEAFKPAGQKKRARKLISTPRPQ